MVEILRHTRQPWGIAQLARYQRKLEASFRVLCNNPALGPARTDLPFECRTYLVGAHVVVYRVRPPSLEVIRILDQRMSLGRQLVS